MSLDPTKEIKRIRHELSQKAGFSVRSIFNDLRSRRQASNHEYIEAPTVHSRELLGRSRGVNSPDSANR